MIKLIAGCAIVFAALSTQAAAWIVILAVVVLGFRRERRLGDAGIKGGALAGAAAFVGFGFALCAYLILSNAEYALLVFDPVSFFASLAIAGSLFGALVSSVLRLIMRGAQFFHKPLSDELCGPIVLSGYLAEKKESV